MAVSWRLPGRGAPRRIPLSPAAHRDDCACGALTAAEELGVEDSEPTVRSLAPRPPTCRDPLQIGACRQAIPDSLIGDGGVQDAVSPHVAPPAPTLRCRVQPRRRGCIDISETCRLGPGQQTPPSVGLASVTPVGLSVEIQTTGGQRKPAGYGGCRATKSTHTQRSPVRPACPSRRSATSPPAGAPTSSPTRKKSLTAMRIN